MTFAVWVILTLVLLIIGAVLAEVWRLRQKLQQSEYTQAENSAEWDSILYTGVSSPNGTAHSVSTDGTTRFSQITTLLSEQVSHKIQDFHKSRSTLKQFDRVIQFRLWLVDAFDEDLEIRQWLGSLSDEQLEAYSGYLARFCQDAGFELNWLLDGRMAQEPKLSSSLEKIILCYSQASYHAISTHQEVIVFNILYDYLQDPICHKNLTISQRVFGRLIEKGLIAVNISEHLTLSKRRQTEQILQVIQTTAAQYPETFKSLAVEVLIVPTSLEPAIDTTVTDDINSNGAVNSRNPVLETVPIPV